MNTSKISASVNSQVVYVFFCAEAVYSRTETAACACQVMEQITQHRPICVTKVMQPLRHDRFQVQSSLRSRHMPVTL